MAALEYLWSQCYFLGHERGRDHPSLASDPVFALAAQSKPSPRAAGLRERTNLHELVRSE